MKGKLIRQNSIIKAVDTKVGDLMITVKNICIDHGHVLLHIKEGFIDFDSSVLCVVDGTDVDVRLLDNDEVYELRNT
ncbi:MAG: hypothetical protein M0R17_06265 [Candidatus Omnitrophica bacterium]|jgi:hypothetical protein|nr:hypothetical protein [Candidatus Omnitrophota bacterium]